MVQLARITGLVLTALSALLGIWVEGVTNPLICWNLLPLAIAAFVLARHIPSHSLPVGVFSLLTVAAVVSLHLAWTFDWGGTATGSSTAGLVFLVWPVCSLLIGGAGALLAVLLRAVKTTVHGA